MIYGAHALLYSRAPAQTRAVLDLVLGTKTVDAGGGWLIFALPPSEIAVHPTDGAPRTDLYLMCQDIEKTILELREKGVKFSKPIHDESWGRVTAIALPDGGELGLYQPRHASPVARPSAGSRSTAGKSRSATNGSRSRAAHATGSKTRGG
jgi:hypothetical protein